MEKGQFIQHIKFPFPNKKDLLLIIINNGECYMLETQSDKILDFNLNNNHGAGVKCMSPHEIVDINSNSDDSHCSEDVESACDVGMLKTHEDQDIQPG